ncbi:hypothetical protein G7046_g827 [Stylonectria norvegica]|nr:hypothetical protein G7046_g827 [Stylonectria norvegica]
MLHRNMNLGWISASGQSSTAAASANYSTGPDDALRLRARGGTMPVELLMALIISIRRPLLACDGPEPNQQGQAGQAPVAARPAGVIPQSISHPFECPN